MKVPFNVHVTSIKILFLPGVFWNLCLCLSMTHKLLSVLLLNFTGDVQGWIVSIIILALINANGVLFNSTKVQCIMS